MCMHAMCIICVSGCPARPVCRSKRRVVTLAHRPPFKQGSHLHAVNAIANLYCRRRSNPIYSGRLLGFCRSARAPDAAILLTWLGAHRQEQDFRGGVSTLEQSRRLALHPDRDGEVGILWTLGGPEILATSCDD